MKAKRAALITIIFTMTLLISGCGEKYPDLTDAEYDQVVEYAVGLLMKYSNNGQDKLTFVDAKEIQKERDKEAKETAKLEEEKAKEHRVEPSRVEHSLAHSTENDESSSASSDKKPEDEELGAGEDSSEIASKESSEETVDEKKNDEEVTSSSIITLSSDEVQEIVDDIFLSYQGYSISSNYPESSKSYVVNADKGKKLLVLRFDLYNASGSTKKVNLINQNLLFQILLNDKNIGYSSVTFLPNDLSSYMGEIESKAHESLVILTQISADEATSVEKLGMIVSQKGVEQEVILK